MIKAHLHRGLRVKIGVLGPVRRRVDGVSVVSSMVLSGYLILAKDVPGSVVRARSLEVDVHRVEDGVVVGVHGAQDVVDQVVRPGELQPGHGVVVVVSVDLRRWDGQILAAVLLPNLWHVLERLLVS